MPKGQRVILDGEGRMVEEALSHLLPKPLLHGSAQIPGIYFLVSLSSRGPSYLEVLEFVGHAWIYTCSPHVETLSGQRVVRNVLAGICNT